MMRRVAPVGGRALAALVLAVVGFGSLATVCVVTDCTCRTRQVSQLPFSFSAVGRLAVNPTTGLLYAAAEDAMEIAVFDTAHLDGGPLTRVPTEGYHNGLALDDRANRVYLVQQFAGRVRVIDGLTHVFHDLEVPDLVNAMGAAAVDPVRERLYVVRTDNDDIAVFDTATDAFLGSIGQGCCTSKSNDMAVDPRTGLLLVLDQTPPRVTVYEDDGRKLAEVPVGDVPTSIALDAASRRAYVPSRDTLTISVIDVAPESPTAFTAVSKVPVRDAPFGIALDPTARRAYVTNNAVDSLSTIDLRSGRHVQDLRIGFQPNFLAVDPATARVYASLADQSVAVVQGCPVPRRAGGVGSRAAAVTVPTPDTHPNPAAVAERRKAVRCTRMFRIRTQCIGGNEPAEVALAQAEITAAGAQVVEGGAAGQTCGFPPDYMEPDLAAAGFYYSVPVIEAGEAAPTVWTYHTTSRTVGGASPPAGAAVTRVTEPPATPWQEALWYLSRYKTKQAPEAGCE